MDFESFFIKEIKHFAKELIKQSLNSKTPRRNFSKSDQLVTRIVQNFRCNRCGKILGERYNFHHKDGNHSNNHISNCEALCLDCHDEETRRARIRRKFGSRVA